MFKVPINIMLSAPGSFWLLCVLDENFWKKAYEGFYPRNTAGKI
jgi:hypothetical protein